MNNNLFSEKLNRIDTAVERIRTKANLSDAVIEDVATYVEEMPIPEGNIDITSNGKIDVTNYAEATVNIPIDTYKVSSIEERDMLNVNEGDMCVIHSLEEFNCDGIKFGDTLIFPEVITVDTAISSSYSMYMQYADDSMSRINFNLSASMFRILDYYDYTTIANYTSSDGITYTRQTAMSERKFDNTLKMYSTMTFNPVFTPFVILRNLVFEGLFQYNEGQWNNAIIGISTNPDHVFSTDNYYSDSGVQQGTFDRTRYLENNVFVSYDTPTNGAKVWFKPISLVDGTSHTTYTSDKLTNISFTNKNYNQYNSVKSPTVLGKGTYGTNAGNMHYSQIVVDNYLYIFKSSTTSCPSYKFNLDTGARSSVAALPSALGSWNTQTHLCHNNGYIYCFDGTDACYRYSISGNSWSTRAVPTGTGGFSLSNGTNVYIISTLLSGVTRYSTSGNSYTKITVPTTATSSSRMSILFIEGTKIYFLASSEKQLKVYDYVNNTVDAVVNIDAKYFTTKYTYPGVNHHYGYCTVDYTLPYVSDDGKYAYSFSEEVTSASTTSSPKNQVMITDISVVKEAISTNNGNLLFTKNAFTKKYLCLNAPYLSNLEYYNGYFYGHCFNTDEVVKMTLNDILEYSIPDQYYYTLMYDTSSPKYLIPIKEKEKVALNDIFLIYPSSKYIVIGNTYILDENSGEYTCLIENVAE